MTSSQIARATDAERAEARSLSADRRRKLRLELGDSEGISTLLENSMLGAEGAPARFLLCLLFIWPAMWPAKSMENWDACLAAHKYYREDSLIFLRSYGKMLV